MRVKVYYHAFTYVDVSNDYKEMDAYNQCWDYDDKLDRLSDEVSAQLPPMQRKLLVLPAMQTPRFCMSHK